MMEKKKKKNIAQNCFFKQKKSLLLQIYYLSMSHGFISQQYLPICVCCNVWICEKKNKIMHVSTGGVYDFKNP